MFFRVVHFTNKQEIIDYYNKLYFSNEALYKDCSITFEVYLDNKKDLELNFEFDMLYYGFNYNMQ